jgi:hypothetical protein
MSVMQRSISALGVLLLVSATFGCAVCASPDDYMGPVPADGFGFNDRAGSILAAAPVPQPEFQSEVNQDATGETISSGTPTSPPPMQGEPTPAPELGPQSRRIDQSQLR